jgi:uncharacterized protein (DUF1501 family)
MMQMSRRRFMRFAAGLGLSAGGAAMLEKLCLTQAFAQTQTDYKALVCVFLAGGNDGNQVCVPLSGANANFGSADVTGGYPAYFNERNLAGAGLVTNGSGTVAPAGPTTDPSPTPSNANTLWNISAGAGNPNLSNFGLNYYLGTSFKATTGTVSIQMPSFVSLYRAGQGAVVCNVGTLVQPFTKAQYQAQPTNRPDQLFSHSDQVRENQTCIFHVTAPSGTPNGTGWGGRIADKVTLNGTAKFPMATSLSGAPQFMNGVTTFPIAISPAPTALNQVLVLNGFGTATDEVARRTAFNQIRQIDIGTSNTLIGPNKLVDRNSQIMQDALDVSSSLSVDPTLSVPDPTTQGNTIALTFPNTTLGNQFKQVAKVIKANLQQPVLGLKRQIFFCQVGGFDTHQFELRDQPGLLQQLNESMSTFFYWLQNNVPTKGTTEPTLGDLSPKVACFTLSDFSRTFNPSGSGAIVGTDHAWGNNWLVLGGAVKGTSLYGVPLPGGNGEVFPTLGKGTNNAYDVDNANGRGRWIPSVSTTQYAHTLAHGFGLPQDTGTNNNGTLNYVFPYIGNFGQTTLAFL